MAKSKTHINQLIFRRLIGDISEEDNLLLNQWVEQSDDHRHFYEQIVSDTHLTEGYKEYEQVDAEKAWHRFEKEYFLKHTITLSVLRYAAILMLPIVGIAIWLLIANSNRYEPKLSQQAHAAMIKAEQQGKDQATLILPSGKQVALSSSLDKTTADRTPVKAQDLASAYENSEDNTLVTRKNSEYWLTFEDGTVVHLNYNTTLKYPAHFANTDRTIYLEGEAYFQVAPDKKRPFRIITANGTVKEYGTTFNVNTKNDEGGTEVVLVEGSVSLSSQNGREYMLRPGQLATAKPGSDVISVSNIDVEPYVAWNNGRFLFDDYPLERIMNVISQWYGMKVKFETPEIRQMHFTGDMDRYGTIEPIIKAIRTVTRLDVQIKGNCIVLKNPITN
jgi:transmembrane sensor